jgi:hypothetical protein
MCLEISIKHLEFIQIEIEIEIGIEIKVVLSPHCPNQIAL